MGEATNSYFVLLCLGTPGNARVTYHFRPLLGPNLPVLLRKPGQSSLLIATFATSHQLTLKKCGPLGRTEQHTLIFGQSNIPFIEQDIAVPKIVHRILTFGKGHHLPKDTEHPEGRTVASVAFYAEVEAGLCVLCCEKRSTFAVCDECKEHYCTECIDTHTCGSNVVGEVQVTVGVLEFTAIALLCNVLCREGVQCNVVYSGGLSMRG